MIRLGYSPVFIILLFFGLSCNPVQDVRRLDIPFAEIPVDEAVGFRIFRSEGGFVLKISEPGTDEAVQWISTKTVQDDSTQMTILHEKPTRVVCLSTTYLSFIEALDEVNSLVGLSNPELVYSEDINKRIDADLITDVGSDQSLNYERLVELQPDIVLVYDFGPGTAKVISRMREFGLTVVRIQEFKEQTPLGKAEWIKFFGVLFNKLELADSIYDAISVRYDSLKMTAQFMSTIPSVFTGLPWKGEWYQPGGASFQARYLKDAGANYLWSRNEDVSGIMLDKEVIYDQALDADFWIHPNNVQSLDEITAMDPRHGVFESFRKGRVYNNNKRLNKNLGNDYWESGMIKPDVILKDLIAIFHPHVFPDYELYYYQKLEKAK